MWVCYYCQSCILYFRSDNIFNSNALENQKTLLCPMLYCHRAVKQLKLVNTLSSINTGITTNNKFLRQFSTFYNKNLPIMPTTAGLVQPVMHNCTETLHSLSLFLILFLIMFIRFIITNIILLLCRIILTAQCKLGQHSTLVLPCN